MGDVAETPTPNVVREITLSGHPYRIAVSLGAVKRLRKTPAGQAFFAGKNPFEGMDDPGEMIELMIPFFCAVILPENGKRPTEEEMEDRIMLADIPRLIPLIGEIVTESLGSKSESDAEAEPELDPFVAAP